MRYADSPHFAVRGARVHRASTNRLPVCKRASCKPTDRTFSHLVFLTTEDPAAVTCHDCGAPR